MVFKVALGGLSVWSPFSRSDKPRAQAAKSRWDLDSRYFGDLVIKRYSFIFQYVLFEQDRHQLHLDCNVYLLLLIPNFLFLDSF